MLVIIQARSSSKRFPNKILYKIKSKSIISRVLFNISKSKLVTKIVVATSNDKSDSKFVKLLKKKKIRFYRGSLNNVALRLVKASQKFKSKYFIRISGDSPLISFKIIDKSIRLFKNNSNADLITNVFPRSFPSGQSVEIVKTKIIKDNLSKMNISEKEHVTTYFYKNKSKFKIINFKNYTKKFKNIGKMTIDYKSDVKKLKKYIR